MTISNTSDYLNSMIDFWKKMLDREDISITLLPINQTVWRTPHLIDTPASWTSAGDSVEPIPMLDIITINLTNQYKDTDSRWSFGYNEELKTLFISEHPYTDEEIGIMKYETYLEAKEVIRAYETW